MLTIKGTYGQQLILGIPNNNVRMQYYNFLLENYSPVFDINTKELVTMFSHMAFDGNWHDALQYMCDCYKQLSSVRDSIEGEHGYCEFSCKSSAIPSSLEYCRAQPKMPLGHYFLLPNMTHYQSKHSYILKLKYLSKSDYTEKKAQEQWDEAVEQINSYAVAPRVEALCQGTQLHKIIILFCGWEMIKMREV